MAEWGEWQEAAESDSLAAAHGYVRRGWRVVPLYGATDDACMCRLGAECPPKNRGKHPRGTASGWRVLTTGADVQEHYEAHPTDNVGLATGPDSGFFVVDIDGDAGRAALAGLVADHGHMPPTKITQTGSGGLHYYLKWPATFAVHNSTSWIGQGIDIRGVAGQVVAPPSRSGLGDYVSLLDAEPAVAPAWLLDMLRDHSKQIAAGKKAEVVKGEPVEMSLVPTSIQEMAGVMLKDGEGRHRHFYALVAACAEAGYTQAETVTIVAPWCARVGKFTGRVAAEVARAWVKIEASADKMGDWLGTEISPESDLGASTPSADTSPAAHAESAPESDLEDPEADSDDLDGGWSPVDCAEYWDGTHEPTMPALVLRSDGQPLLYRGMTHSFHGESESGKSLLAQYCASEVLEDGGRVLYIDFESDPSEVVGRMIELGASHGRDRFAYMQPEMDPRRMPLARRRYEEIARQEWDLIIIDGVTDALGVWGAGSNDNDEIATVMRKFPRWLARKTGAAVVMIDHVTKDTEGRGRFAIGGQAKMAGLTGAAYTIEIDEPFGRGMAGELIMRIGKDRPGGIRGACPKRKRASDRTQEAARVTIDGTEPGVISVVIGMPRDEVPPQDEDSAQAREQAIMQRISEVIEGSAIALKATDIYGEIKGSKPEFNRLLKRLEMAGYVTFEKVGNGHYYKTLKPFRTWPESEVRTSQDQSGPSQDQGGKSSQDRPHPPYGVGPDLARPETEKSGPSQDQSCERCEKPTDPLILARWQGHCYKCARWLGLAES